MSTKPAMATVSSQTESLAEFPKSEKKSESCRVWYGADLPPLRVFEWPIMPYPEKIVVPRMLPDGLPAFNVDQIFGQLPEYIEISLELLTKKRQVFATRFVIDPTVEMNILQMKAIDEFTDPPERIARKVMYVPWAYLQAVPCEWRKAGLRVRRYSSLATKFPPTFYINAYITAAKNLKPAIQVLGKPFVDQYVVSYARYTEDEGAIAIQFGQHLEWIPYERYVPDPPQARTFPFHHSSCN